jgi:ankyrin repeat protein
MMIHKGANINKQNNNGETPLHKAIFNPAVRILMVKLLVRHRADVNIPNLKGGDISLHYSVRLGRRDLVKVKERGEG